jgi:asparagine synthetase B (glutamine-hydrolysing)
VIHDGDQKRVLAARDSEGAQTMHWGVTDDGRFMFGSETAELKDCNPTATPFPAGGPQWPADQKRARTDLPIQKLTPICTL